MHNKLLYKRKMHARKFCSSAAYSGLECMRELKFFQGIGMEHRIKQFLSLSPTFILQSWFKLLLLLPLQLCFEKVVRVPILEFLSVIYSDRGLQTLDLGPGARCGHQQASIRPSCKPCNSPEVGELCRPHIQRIF